MKYTIETEKKVVTIEKTKKEVTLAEYVGYIFFKARISRKLTHQGLADLANVSHAHIRNIEKGLYTLRLKDMENLCGVLEIDIRTLFGGEIPKESEHTL